eukprot:14594667-Alexandrium_andersonii.AAC.1
MCCISSISSPQWGAYCLPALAQTSAAAWRSVPMAKTHPSGISNPLSAASSWASRAGCVAGPARAAGTPRGDRD